jgi:hypothetical protein
MIHGKVRLRGRLLALIAHRLILVLEGLGRLMFHQGVDHPDQILMI